MIQRDTDSNFTAPVVKTAWSNVTSYSDTGLTPGTTYYYRVRAQQRDRQLRLLQYRERDHARHPATPADRLPLRGPLRQPGQLLAAR